MTQLTINDPVPGQANQTEEPKIPQALDAIKAWANGQISLDNFLSTFARSLLVAAQTPNTQPKWNAGVVTLTGPSAADPHYSNQAAVAHGLGLQPQVAFVTAWNDDVVGTIVGQPDPTNIQILGHYMGTAAWPPAWPGTLSCSCAWLAIGW